MSFSQLLSLEDDVLKKQWQAFEAALPPILKEMADTPNTHGHIDIPGIGRRRVTVLEHTLEVIQGQHGGFGLTTAIVGAPDDCNILIRKSLRIAALFHDIGKQEGPYDHIEKSAKKAGDELSKNPQQYGIEVEDIPLITALIRDNDLFYKFTGRDSTMRIEDVGSELQKSHAASKSNIAFEVYCRMLLNLYLADSSTLTVVQKRRAIYRTYITSDICFTNLFWLSQLKESLNSQPVGE